MSGIRCGDICVSQSNPDDANLHQMTIVAVAANPALARRGLQRHEYGRVGALPRPHSSGFADRSSRGRGTATGAMRIARAGVVPTQLPKHVGVREIPGGQTPGNPRLLGRDNSLVQKSVERGWIGSIAGGLTVSRRSSRSIAFPGINGSSPQGRVPSILFQGAIERSAATCGSSPPAISPATRRFT